MQNMFDDYNPSELDLTFDYDDLVGIAIKDDDPCYQTAIKKLYNSISESEDVNSVTKAIEFETDDSTNDIELLDVEPDDTETSVEGMDAEDLMDAALEIISGEADDESDLIDYIDNK